MVVGFYKGEGKERKKKEKGPAAGRHRCAPDLLSPQLQTVFFFSSFLEKFLFDFLCDALRRKDRAHKETNN